MSAGNTKYYEFKCVGWIDLVHDRRHRLRNRSIRGRSVNTIPHTVYHAAQCALDRLTDYIRRKQAQPPPPTPPQVIPESIQRRKKTSTISKLSHYCTHTHIWSCTKIALPEYARERWSFAGIEIRKLTQPIRIGQIRGHGAGASTTLKQENSE